MKRVTSIMAALVLGAMAGAGGAQEAVYKCGAGIYSDHACSSRIVRTYDAPVPTPRKVRDGVSRQLPGETVAEYTVRKHRAHMKETDRDECARLDKRIPFEQERAKSTNEEEIDDAQQALDISRRRFRTLGC